MNLNKLEKIIPKIRQEIFLIESHIGKAQSRNQEVKGIGCQYIGYDKDLSIYKFLNSDGLGQGNEFIDINESELCFWHWTDLNGFDEIISFMGLKQNGK